MKKIHETARAVDVILETEVLVVGSGPGGLAAALAAARAGAKTALLERNGCFGGNITQVGVEGFAWYRHEKTVDSEGIGIEFEERAKAMGVIVAFGTDAGVFEHGRNGSEFALLVNAGMTPTEALASATTVAAKTLGMENDIGRIAIGYSADLVAVNENPLNNIRTLEKAEWVMVRGRIIP